ncbi:MAG TPA: carboxypeptidase-like regulatory domain-containing protein, partial [Acidobacteriaceae bacterium]|nr:carboxypeptidase-like regulatory domain-containing protein [Acidobacteriaceae bacterium]
MKQFRFRWLITAVATVLWLCTGAPHAFSQATNTGTIVGNVTDPSGAVIAGATVTLTNAAEGTRMSVTSNGQGQYIISAVPPGTYDLTTSKSGFSNSRTTGLVVNVGTQTTANIKLNVGGGKETVEVQVMGTELQTLNSTVGQSIPQEAISSLPSLNHDVNTFTELQPGVSPDGSVAGAVVDQSTFLLDGGNNSNDMDGSMTVYTPSFAGDPTGIANNATGAAGPTGVMPTPTDSIEEFKVNTANQTADFDNSSGAQVELVTPRGSNRWHGGVYEYYLDNNYDANTWNNNQTDTALTSYHYSRFGAKAGGFFLPSMLGGRWYIFGFYEGYRFPESETWERAVPTANMESGILQLPDANGNLQTYNMKTIDPRDKGINPTVQAMWTKYMPAGNDPSCGGLLGSRCDGVNEIGYKANLSIPDTSNDMAFRIDHDFNAKWHFFASYRYYKEELTTDSQVDIGGFFPGDTLGTPAALSHRPQQPYYLVAGLTTSISSNTTNDFHYSFLRNYWS